MKNHTYLKIKINDTPRAQATLPILLECLQLFIFRFAKLIGIKSSYPDYEKTHQSVDLWLYEYSPSQIYGPVRELGYDGEGRLIVVTPNERNQCISTDSIEDIELNPDVYSAIKTISKEEFESAWSKRDQVVKQISE